MTPSKKQKPIVVVVNDNAAICRVLADLLRNGGMDVRDFLEAEAALRAFDAGLTPDLIVTDLYMPGIDGWQFCRLLRSPDCILSNNVPILVISATFSGDEPARITTDLGANAFLPQPVESTVLLKTVNALLQHEAPAQRPRMLVVDDEKHIAKLLKATFEQHGYEVDMAHTGADGLQMFDSNYNIAILDYHLTDMLGDQLLKEFRRRCPGCAVIMMTADSDPQLAVTWMKAGAAAYALKPCDPKYVVELCAKARRERALLWAEEKLEERTNELRRSEERFRELANLLPVTVFESDANFNLTYANRRAFELFGYSQEEVARGLNGLEMLAPAERDRARATYAMRAEGVHPGALEYQALKRDGSTFPVLFHASPIMEDGKVAGLRGVIIDITERKQATQERDRLMAAIEQAAEIIMITDADGVIEYVNPAFHQVTGYSRDEALGQNPRFLGSAGRDNAFFEQMWDTLLHGDTWHGRFVNTRKNGSSYTEDAVISPVRDSTGRTVNYVAVKRDITEELQMEEQLRQAQKLESVGTLASGMAHEINNPINGILNYAQLMQDHLQGTDDVLEEYAGVIMTETERIASVVRSLLALARCETHACSPARMSDIVAGALDPFSALLQKDHITLDVDVPQALPPLMCRSQQIHHVVVSLITNARDALNARYPAYDTNKKLSLCAREVRCDPSGTEPRGSAGIPGLVPGAAAHASAAGQSIIRLTVEDHGQGIPEPMQARIFEPFFTTRDKSIGAGALGKGTGLFISHSIVQEHGGRLSVESKAGQWTRIHMDLPIEQQGQE